MLSRLGAARRPLTMALAGIGGLRRWRFGLSAAASASAAPIRLLETGTSAVMESFRSPAVDPATGRVLALNRLRPAPDARKRNRMLGRGEGSHKGKSAGRGMRGTYHRRALRKRNFEGGQTPMFRRLPKRGHHTPPMFQERFTEVSVGLLQYYAQTGRIDATKPVQLRHLVACGHTPSRDGIRITGDGAERLVIPLHLEVSRTDELARFAIEQTGGTVKLVYFSRLGMRAHLYPERFAILPAVANVPPPKKRFHYVPYDLEGRIPPLLFKSRIAASSPLAKFWTPSPVATAYLGAVAKRDAARAEIARQLGKPLPAAATAAAKPAAKPTAAAAQ